MLQPAFLTPPRKTLDLKIDLKISEGEVTQSSAQRLLYRLDIGIGYYSITVSLTYT